MAALVSKDDSSTSDSGGEFLQEETTTSISSSSALKPAASSGTSIPSQETETPLTMTLPSARAYQLEMLEESLKQNVIITMDTGSGKTRVAVMRIIKELERSEKIVWFLAPTVDLANQQFDVLRAQIPAVQSKFICGADNVRAWSSQGVWDSVLLNVRIVVSTFQILFDAVQHAFVQLDSLALLVIDEAHNCVKDNPAARLMKEFYTPAKQAGKTVPHILGLTASPLMRTNLDGIGILEVTLDAICKTPTRHRDELLAQVNRPVIKTVSYGIPDAPILSANPTRTMASLKRAYNQLDIRTDPYILQLLSRRNTPQNQENLRTAVQKHNTYSQRQMKSFCVRSFEICKEIGPWAADYYIHRVITEFTKSSVETGALLEGWSEQERVYLAKTFQQVELLPLGEPTNLSLKMGALLSVLQEDRVKPMGIVFVKERATAAVLSHILSIHPLTKSRYRVGSVVGSSKMPGKRRDFLDLSRKEDIFSLENFRNGKFNLMVATSVLEEGIDVPACNLVICFDELTSPKAFIQRRGRARMDTSQLYLLVEDPESETAKKWQDFERKMKERYEDDMRDKKIIEEIEESEAGLVEYEVLAVESTGARLTIRDAKGHLQHFCASLSTRKFVDWSPYYIFHDTNGNPVADVTQQIPMTATVHLPASLDPSLRKFTGLRAWPSERNAEMDAAFQAYRALYKAGLISENLLPLRESDIFGKVELRTGYSTVREQINPWCAVAQAWNNDRPGQELFTRRLTFSHPDQSIRAEFELTLPVPVPFMEPLTLWWDCHSSWSLTMGEELVVPRGSSECSATDHTSALLAYALTYRHRKPLEESEKKQYPFRLVSLDSKISISDMGAADFDPSLAQQGLLPDHLIRDPLDFHHPYHYICTVPSKPPVELIGRPYRGFDLAPEEVPYAALRNWPKKAGYFRRPSNNDPVTSPTTTINQTKPYPRVLPASQCKVDTVPAIYTHIGMLLPALTRALEIHLVAADLLKSRLGDLFSPPLSLSSLPSTATSTAPFSLITTALCATAARTPTDYERIEFLGDSILKFCATVNVSAKNLLWPEGYLSLAKDHIVANSGLARAATAFGLDRYVVYNAFTLHRWRPVYVEDLLERGFDEARRKTRELPTKTLADVVEALIGVAFMVGGYRKALECIRLLVPMPVPGGKKSGDGNGGGDGKWMGIEECREVLFNNTQGGFPLPVTMRGLEERLVGYTFEKKALLVEALTHCSYTGTGLGAVGDGTTDSIACLDRMEFLGDSILDYVVVKELFKIQSQGSEGEGEGLENSDMHLLRTALVNGDLLAFLVMEWAIEEERSEFAMASDNTTLDEGGDGISDSGLSGPKVGENELRVTNVKTPLWSFMRHSSPGMGIIQQETARRHSALREQLLDALFGNGTHYPWDLLLRLQAQKFYSDLFESLLGAIWVDSGSIEECAKVVERIGILRLLRRLRRDRVHVLHPKEELGRLAVSEKVEYNVEEEFLDGGETGGGVGERGGTYENDGNENADNRTFGCRILVGERCVAHVHGGLSKEEARVMAAKEACRALKGGSRLDDIISV